MKRDDLLISAQMLKQVDEKSASEFSQKRDLLVDRMNKRMLARPDLLELVGKNNSEMMMDNHANHARFLESIFIQQNSEVLVDTVLWVFRAYRSRNFSSTYWAAQLNGWIEIYQEHLSAECYKSIYPYYNWMQINIPVFNHLAEENLELSHSAHADHLKDD